MDVSPVRRGTLAVVVIFVGIHGSVLDIPYKTAMIIVAAGFGQKLHLCVSAAHLASTGESSTLNSPTFSLAGYMQTYGYSVAFFAVSKTENEFQKFQIIETYL